MSPTIYQQDNSGEIFFSFNSSEKEKYSQFVPNKSEIIEYEEKTYYLLGYNKGYLEPNKKYKKWVYENNVDIVYLKDIKHFFPKLHYIQNLSDDLIVANNY